MTPLSVFVTADPELPVPPRHYGGIERVVAQLVDGLVTRGHRVTLFAHPESVTMADLIPYPGQHSQRAGITARHATLLAREYARRRPDVIHSFGRLAYLMAVLPMPVPKIMSYQRIVTRSRVLWADRLARGTLSFTGCSRRLVEPVEDVGRWRVLYNSVDVNRLTFRAEVRPDAPLVFLGRIEHIKGTHVAIDVAHRAGRRLVIAGNVEPAHRDYFEAEVAPHVDDVHVRYVGPVNDAAKNDLLGQAAALLMPVLWEEPFGIVMAEALACGTPVLGLARGAVPEVVLPGRTGFVCETADELVDAVGAIPSIGRAACRADAERRFSQTALVEECLALYAAVGAGRSPRSPTPGHAGEEQPVAR